MKERPLNPLHREIAASPYAEMTALMPEHVSNITIYTYGEGKGHINFDHPKICSFIYGSLLKVSESCSLCDTYFMVQLGGMKRMDGDQARPECAVCSEKVGIATGRWNTCE